MLTDSVIIEVTNGVNTDRTTIFKLHDGADGVAGVIFALSNEVHVLSAASNGTVASYASATTTVTIWRGTLNDTANWDIDITPSSGVTASITYPGGIPTVAITDMTANDGYVEISATRTGYDSPNPVKFTLAKSLAGNNGTNGTAGPPGANGQTTYLHIKYSNDGGTSFTANSGEDVGAYMGTYTDFTLADSNSPSAYTWALIRGANGTNGTPGTPGSNGQSTYLHIKYSNDGGGSFTTNNGEDVGAYMGTYTDFTLADSNSVGAYTWALIRGANGATGPAGSAGTPGTPGPNGQSTYLHIKYSNNGGVSFTTNNGEDPGTYIGTYTDFTLLDSNSVGAYSWALIKGADGTNGSNGQDAVTANLTVDSISFPAYSDGPVISYSGATTLMTVIKGSTDDSANWTFSHTKSDAGISTSTSGSPSGRQVSITAVPNGVNSGYIEITASRSGYTSQVRRFTWTKSKSAVPSAGPVMNPGNLGAYGYRLTVTGSRTVTAKIEFRTDGTIYMVVNANSDSTSTVKLGDWYLPSTSGIGSSYNISFFTVNNFGSNTGWTYSDGTISATRYVQLSVTGTSAFSYSRALTYTITKVSDGSYVGGGNISLGIDREF